MKKDQIYGIGAALVDTEVVVSDAFLQKKGIEKGVMTLVDESRQAELIQAFTADKHHLMKKSGGSACNTVIAAANFGANTVFSGKVAADAVDTNGAGDMFAGAFLYAVTAGRDLKWAAELANESDARVVGQFGPRFDAIEFDSIRQKLGI